MPKIEFVSAYDAETDSYLVFREGVDTSVYDPSKLVEWSFESRPRTALLAIRAADTVSEYGLKTGAEGQYDTAAYGMAMAVSYARTYLVKYSRAGVEFAAPTKEQIEALPDIIIGNYLGMSNRAPSLDSLKKLTPESTTTTPETNSMPQEHVLTTQPAESAAESA